jgi:DNA-binding transcriptional MerR regulator
MNSFTVGALAAKAGINLETVRYYEKIGLMPKPKRRESHYRIYD